ncbi:MAG: WD40 repeat domain-containing protein, partial [Limisphaerales bacterium]
GDDLSVRLWQVADGAFMGRLDGHAQAVRALRELPDGEIISGDDAGEIRRWRRPAHGRRMLEERFWSRLGGALLAGPAGRLAVTDAAGDTALVSVTPELEVVQRLPGGFEPLGFTEDARYLFTLTRSNEVLRWQLPAGPSQVAWSASAQGVQSVGATVLSKDAAWLAFADGEAGAALVHLPEARLVQRVPTSKRINALAIHVPARRWAFGGDDGWLRLGELRLSGPIGLMSRDLGSPVNALAISSDGQSLTALLEDGQLLALAIPALAVLHSRRIEGTSHALRFDSFGRRLLIPAVAGGVLILDGKGEETARLRPFDYGFSRAGSATVDVATSPEGNWVAAINGEGQIRVLPTSSFIP